MNDGPIAIAARDPWDALRDATAARVALGRSGAALPTAALLAFELDHARARDAVHQALDVDALAAALRAATDDVLRVRSAADDRATYLLRPDLGRRLSDESRATLASRGRASCDIAIVVADGLSALGIQAHAPALIEALAPQLEGFAIGPLVIAEQARVALGDDVGEALRARLAVIVIGERPGLTSPDSIGCYLTFDPRRGRHDAQRNCVSNIRPQGLAPQAAAVRIAWLARAALGLSLTGVGLKDDSALIDVDGPAGP